MVASRYVPGGSTPNWPFMRRLMSRIACLLARPLSPIRDAASGFFLIRAIDRARRDDQGGRLQDLPRAARARLAGAAGGIPYRFDDRELGESKMSMREASGYLVQLQDLYQLYAVKFRRPRDETGSCRQMTIRSRRPDAERIVRAAATLSSAAASRQLGAASRPRGAPKSTRDATCQATLHLSRRA